jgi:hypothetical protein
MLYSDSNIPLYDTRPIRLVPAPYLSGPPPTEKWFEAWLLVQNNSSPRARTVSFLGLKIKLHEVDGSYSMLPKPAHQRELRKQIRDSNGKQSFNVPVKIEDLHSNAQSEIQELLRNRNNCARPPYVWTVATIINALASRTLKDGQHRILKARQIEKSLTVILEAGVQDINTLNTGPGLPNRHAEYPFGPLPLYPDPFSIPADMMSTIDRRRGTSRPVETVDESSLSEEYISSTTSSRITSQLSSHNSGNFYSDQPRNETRGARHKGYSIAEELLRDKDLPPGLIESIKAAEFRMDRYVRVFVRRVLPWEARAARQKRYSHSRHAHQEQYHRAVSVSHDVKSRQMRTEGLRKVAEMRRRKSAFGPTIPTPGRPNMPIKQVYIPQFRPTAHIRQTFM